MMEEEDGGGELSGGFFSELFDDDNNNNIDCLLPSSTSSSCGGGDDSSWIQQIETMLFNDDNIIRENPSAIEDAFFADLEFPQVQEDAFFSDVFVDDGADLVLTSAENSTDDGGGGALETDDKERENPPSERESEDKTDANSSDGKEEEPIAKKKEKRSCPASEDIDDPIAKKRTRQMRNRDAAVKSRERKKMYVKDLELKSRYLEGECIRLQRLLHYCTSENHALHLQLQEKAYAASRTKQESAVLLLESLLLGSLLWFLGMLGLFSPLEVCLQLPASKLESVDSSQSKVVDLVALGRAQSKSLGLGTLRLFFKSKRCKASRSRMRFLNCDGAVLAPC